LGQRLRALRKQHGLSQERLGDRAGLSGKFIGEVERGEKSISIDSLYHVAVALEIQLRELTDVRADRPASVPTEEAEKNACPSSPKLSHTYSVVIVTTPRGEVGTGRGARSPAGYDARPNIACRTR